MATKKTKTAEHSKKFGIVKGWYDTYGDSMVVRVRLAVEKGWITPDEYKKITGEDYPG